MTGVTAPSKKQLVWRCRRGSKELDEILSAFMHREFDSLTCAEQKTFAHLLEQPDPQLTDYLCHNKTPTEQGLANIVRRILSAHRA